MNNPVANAVARGFELTLRGLPKKDGEAAAIKVANYLHENYHLECKKDEPEQCAPPLAKRQVTNIPELNPILKLMVNTGNHELVADLNNLVNSINMRIGCFDQTHSQYGESISGTHVQCLKLLGGQINLNNKTKNQLRKSMNWPEEDCKKWNTAISTLCEGCIEPIFDSSLNDTAKKEQLDRVKKLLDDLKSTAPDKSENIELIEYTLKEKYYLPDSTSSFSKIILNNFIGNSDFQVVHATLNALFQFWQFNPREPLAAISPEALTLIKQPPKPSQF